MLEAMCEEEGVRIPGDRRHRHRVEAERHGIEIAEALHAKLLAYAGRTPDRLDQGDA
jgi:(2R)-3-sulfolactate dehydrogenase (NADP+)